MRSLRQWLEDVGVADPTERRVVVTMQVLTVLGLIWVAVALGRIFTAWPELPNVAATLAVTSTVGLLLVASLPLLRSRYHRAGLWVSAIAGNVPLAVVLMVGLNLATPAVRILPIGLAVAALALGRRALWLVLSFDLLALATGALRDQGYLGGPAALSAAAAPLGPFWGPVAALVLLAILLDILGSTLRESAKVALARERHLVQRDDLFRLAFTMSPDAVNITRARDGVYVAANAGFTRLTGWTEAEMLGRTAAERDLWADREQRARLVAAVSQGVPVSDAECLFRRKDGTIIHGLISSQPVTIGGEPYFLSITRDVTARKQAEAERAALQDQLRQAQKLEAVGQLAGGVAHDFNNILTSILASAELLAASLAADTQARADAEQIRRDALRAAELTKRLLTFARRQVVDPRVVRVDDCARDLESMIRRLLGAGVVLECQYGSGVWPTFVDPNQLEQVILNLAVNARDAMPGGGKLGVSVENVVLDAARAKTLELEPGEHVRLSVADEGVGIDPAHLGRIFEPFFTTKGALGVGLGLAICYGIVKQAGGAIDVQSRLGAGTRFDVYLPRTSIPGEVEETGAAVVSGRGHETVLLVEDDPAVRRIAARALGSVGYRVLEAGSRLEAERVAREHAAVIDVAVLDLALPDGSGRDVADMLAAVCPNTPVLFVSGYAGDLADNRGVLESGIAFLPKPYTPEQLTRRLRGLLGAAAARDQV